MIEQTRSSLPFNGGNCCNSTSCEFRYRDDPCDFLLFFFSDRLANGSIRSTNVPADILHSLPTTHVVAAPNP